MRNRRVFGALAVALIALLGAEVIVAGGDSDIGWNVLANGGGHASAGTYTLDATLGQANAGSQAGGSVALCAGFWCLDAQAAASNNPVYLPMVLRQGQ
jgi:hypothetical protein